jgi:hypothetical protein
VATSSDVSAASVSHPSSKSEAGALALLLKRKKDISFIVSIFAVLFSLGTTAVSWWHSKQQEVHDTRVELRGLLQRLSVLQRDLAEARVKYQNDQLALSAIGGAIQQENIVVAKQAVDVSRRIPTRVTANEYAAIASALQSVAEMRLAQEVLLLAIDQADNAHDQAAKIIALRGLGSVLYQAGDFEHGRQRFADAEATIRAEPMNDDFKAYALAYTQESWAWAELGARHCREAADHRALAQVELNKQPDSPGKAETVGWAAKLDSTIPSICNTDHGAGPAAPAFQPPAPPPVKQQ